MRYKKGGAEPLDFSSTSKDVVSGKWTPEPCIRDLWYSQASCVSGAFLACFPSAFWVLAFSSSHPMLKATVGYHLYLWRESTRKPKLGAPQPLRFFIVPFLPDSVTLSRNPGINSSKFHCPLTDANPVFLVLWDPLILNGRSRVRKEEQPSHSLFSPPTNKGPDSRPPAQTVAGPFSPRQGSSCLPPHFASWQLAQEPGKPCPAAGLA